MWPSPSWRSNFAYFVSLCLGAFGVVDLFSMTWADIGEHLSKFNFLFEKPLAVSALVAAILAFIIGKRRPQNLVIQHGEYTLWFDAPDGSSNRYVTVQTLRAYGARVNAMISAYIVDRKLQENAAATVPKDNINYSLSQQYDESLEFVGSNEDGWEVTHKFKKPIPVYRGLSKRTDLVRTGTITILNGHLANRDFVRTRVLNYKTVKLRLRVAFMNSRIPSIVRAEERVGYGVYELDLKKDFTSSPGHTIYYFEREPPGDADEILYNIIWEFSPPTSAPGLPVVGSGAL